MAYWLVKSEPSDYSFNDLTKEGHTTWSGVKNAAAQKNMRAMQSGDQVLFYHTGDEKAVVGLAKVVTAAYPDKQDKSGKAVVVELAAVRSLSKPVTLAAIKADPRFKEWGLVKIGRLSVVPTTAADFKAVLALAGDSGR